MTFRQQNEAIAKEVIRVTLEKMERSDQIAHALEKACQVNQPCRMEKVPVGERLTAYIDVCHNISGLEAVLKELKLSHPGKSIRVACAFSKMKEIQKMIQFLLK